MTVWPECPSLPKKSAKQWADGEGTGENGIRLIKKMESFQKDCYSDTWQCTSRESFAAPHYGTCKTYNKAVEHGPYTIGYGHACFGSGTYLKDNFGITCKKSGPKFDDNGHHTQYGGTTCSGGSLTEAQADTLLRHDLKRYERAVGAAMPDDLNITQNQFDALVTFTMNLGEGRESCTKQDEIDWEELDCPAHTTSSSCRAKTLSLGLGQIAKVPQSLVWWVLGLHSATQVPHGEQTPATLQFELSRFHFQGTQCKRGLGKRHFQEAKLYMSCDGPGAFPCELGNCPVEDGYLNCKSNCNYCKHPKCHEEYGADFCTSDSESLGSEALR